MLKPIGLYIYRYKDNYRNKIINYRPISLLSQIGQIFENIIYNRMQDIIIKHRIVNSNRCGFKEKSNTTISHINLQHIIFPNIIQIQK